LAEDWQNGGFGLYLHWPFCEAKCPYCDFNSHVAREIDQARWRDAYLAEIDRYADALSGRVLGSVFFGGGTPSLMDPATVAAILERIRKRWPVANDLEVTLEANPGSVESGRFRAYASAGVSRVSLGVQALNDPDLKRLGRLHSVAEAEKALDVAAAHFERVSFDLIYARQHQTLEDWQDELRQALTLTGEHLSLYQLTIEDGTGFGMRHAAGTLKGLPENDLAADMYLITQEICDAAGMGAYEVSNHAKPGAESKHNLNYWRYGDYIGIGPGAHGRVTRAGQRYATETWLQPERWLTEAEGGQTERCSTPLSPGTQAAEYLLMGLRIREGIDMTRFTALNGSSLDEDCVRHLEEIGMLERRGTRLMATRRGIPVLNTILTEILPDQ
jgi:oxygen-independent coproporphyrinogen-3 oxidase